MGEKFNKKTDFIVKRGLKMPLPRNEIWPLLFELGEKNLSNYPENFFFFFNLLKLETD